MTGATISNGNTRTRPTPLTVLSPLPRYGPLALTTTFLIGRNLPFLVAKLRRLSFIRYARWTVLPALPPRRSGLWPKRQEGAPFMLFDSNFDGPWEEYLDAFSEAVPWRIDSIWGSTREFPGAKPASTFEDYVREHQFPADYYFAAYPTASTTDIVQALNFVQQGRAIQDRIEAGQDVTTGFGEQLSAMQRLVQVPTEEQPTATNSPVDAVTVITRIKPECLDTLREVLSDRRADLDHRMVRGQVVHVARFVVLDRFPHSGPLRAGDALPGPLLVFTSVFDGSKEAYLDDLYSSLGYLTDRIWDTCEGYPRYARAKGTAVAMYLRDHEISPSLFYTGWSNRSVAEIERALEIKERLQNLAILFQQQPPMPEPELRAKLREVWR